jgi:hypothetical protein
MMTRKDYVTTAEILNGHLSMMDDPTFDSLVESFGLMFKEDNERFMLDKFVDACWGED